MKNIVSVILAVACAAIFMSSCAEKQDDDTLKKQLASFDAWMEYYGDGAVKQPSGIYIKKLESSTSPSAKTPKDGEWVMINYTGRDMTSGDVFVTRDSVVAKHQGTFQYYTHYVPQYVSFKETNSLLIEGNYIALTDMKEGDKWRIYIPSNLAYGSSTYSYDKGYQGEASVRTNMPVIMDLELVKVISDPTQYENLAVAEYAATNWHQLLTDTIQANMYRESLSVGLDTVTVKKDSTVSVFYVGRFLDGFIFDTNIEDTARKYKIYSSSSSYGAKSVYVGNYNLCKGFEDGLLGMKYGETADVIFTSTYAYGSDGSQDGNTVIQPYTPLIFTIEVAPYNGDGSEKYPYNIAGVLKKVKEPQTGTWITAYLVGVVTGDNIKDATFSSDNLKVKTNVLMADKSTTDDASLCITVELPAGEIRDALNLEDNSSLYRKKITIYGDITMDYLGTKGIVNPTKYTK